MSWDLVAGQKPDKSGHTENSRKEWPGKEGVISSGQSGVIGDLFAPDAVTGDLQVDVAGMWL